MHPERQIVLGITHENTENVPQDHTEAAKWYHKSAKQGDAHAQYNLGLMCDKGRGVPQDHAEAAKWYRMAAEQGQVDAQYNLGVKYATGEGVPHDYAEAVKWWRKASDQGFAQAQYSRLLSRNDVEAEYGITRRWLELAAYRGDGPPMIKVSRRCVRYRRADFESWLNARTVANGSDEAV